MASRATPQSRWYYFRQIALFELVCDDGKSEQEKKQICERHPFARKMSNYLIRLCTDARRSTNDPHEGRQNESGKGHCKGPPVKQRYAQQRQAENDKFHVLRDEQFDQSKVERLTGIQRGCGNVRLWVTY